MCEFPKWAGEQAVFRVREQNPDFPPSDGRLRLCLVDAVRPYRFAAEWNAQAQKQIAERPIEETKVPLSAERQSTVCTDFTEAFAAHGRPIGPFETGRQLPYRS
jgi:hypothetical protein